MESIFSLIFLAIQNRIIDQVTTIKHVNEDTGQLMDENPALSYPCVLIAIERGTFTDLAENAQIGTVNITIKLVVAPRSATANNTPTDYKKKGLDYYELEQDLHKALQGWAPAYVDVVDGPDLLADVCGALSRTQSIQNRSRADLRIREITYTLGIDDYTTKRIQLFEPVTPVFDVHFEELDL